MSPAMPLIKNKYFSCVKEWGTLTSEQKGELTGCLFNKCGADFFIPGLG